MPASLSITVVSRWSELRGDKFELIRQQVEDEVRTWGQDLSDAEVHMSVIGSPTHPVPSVYTRASRGERSRTICGND
jgi:hypothetical protein